MENGEWFEFEGKERAMWMGIERERWRREEEGGGSGRSSHGGAGFCFEGFKVGKEMRREDSVSKGNWLLDKIS